MNESDIEEYLYDWVDEMEEVGYFIPSASFTWDNVVDFSLWLINKLKGVRK